MVLAHFSPLPSASDVCTCVSLAGYALLALTACGTGLNLAMADTVVFAELCWSPALLEQVTMTLPHRWSDSQHHQLWYSHHVCLTTATAGRGARAPDGAAVGGGQHLLLAGG
eukprot:1709540-Prymnesium_polylepis.2